MLWLLTVTPGCVSTPRQLAVDTVSISDSLMLTLPDAADIVDHLDATQVLTGTYDGQTYNMQVQLEWRPGSLVLAALNIWGTSLFSVSYDGDDLHTLGNRLVMRGLEAEYILADILVTYWSRPRLEERLSGTGLEIVDERSRRTISTNGEPVIIIDYENATRWEGGVKFTHIERGYSLDIETIEFSRQ